MAGVFTSHSYLDVHPPLPIRFRGSGSYGLAFAASLARFLCCLCLHSRVGEKERPRRKKQTGKVSGSVDVISAIDFTRFFHWEDSELTSFCSRLGL